MADLEGVFLHTVDAVRGHVDENLARRRRAVPRVEAIVEEELLSYLDWVRTLEVMPTLRALCERFEAVRAEEVGRHLGRFSKEDAERVESLTRSLVNKLLHTPITRLKARGSGDGQDLRRLDAAPRALRPRGGEERAWGGRRCLRRCASAPGGARSRLGRRARWSDCSSPRGPASGSSGRY